MELDESDYEKFRKICEKEQRSMRSQLKNLALKFIKEKEKEGVVK